MENVDLASIDFIYTGPHPFIENQNRIFAPFNYTIVEALFWVPLESMKLGFVYAGKTGGLTSTNDCFAVLVGPLNSNKIMV